MEPLISIIIPAYNVAPYIKKCVTSVINQKYTNLEIILINDGSTDDTGKICDLLKEEDNRIQVIHKRNGGLSTARNAGLDAAKGEWIAFLDSDDWVEPDMYSTLYRIATCSNADIASCKTRNCLLNQISPNVDDTEEIIELTPDQMIKGLRNQRIVRFEVWNKLWKASLIGKVRFKEGQVSEDVYFDRVLFLKANKMVHIEKTLHNYLIQRPGNTLSSFKEARLCVFDEFDALKEDLKSMGNNDTVDVINCIACSFAITIYAQAVDTNQTHSMKKKIKDIFDTYYRESRFSKNRSIKGNLGVELFYISPSFYLRVWEKMYGKR